MVPSAPKPITIGSTPRRATESSLLYEEISYEDERPGCWPVVVRQMPHEETHDAAYYQARQELQKAQRVEWYAWVVRRRRLRAAVERVHHGHSVLFPIFSTMSSCSLLVAIASSVVLQLGYLGMCHVEVVEVRYWLWIRNVVACGQRR